MPANPAKPPTDRKPGRGRDDESWAASTAGESSSEGVLEEGARAEAAHLVRRSKRKAS